MLDAQAAVKSIKKQHLVELRTMSMPPPAVKLALESVCVLLGESVTDWKSIRLEFIFPSKVLVPEISSILPPEIQ